MISPEESSKQIKRLAGLDFYPAKEPAALKELRVAGEVAGSVAILDRVVTKWLQEESKSPAPAELRSLVWQANSQYDDEVLERRERTGACPHCGGTGFEIVKGLDRNTGLEITGAKQCRCRVQAA